MASHRHTAVAARAIQLAIREGLFTASDVCRTLRHPPMQHAVTQILEHLETEGWIERVDSESSVWRAGDLAARYGKMDDHAKRQARVRA